MEDEPVLELSSVEEAVQLELISVEDEAELPPEEAEEIEMEENTNGEIQIP